jgi:plastocyanin
MRKTSIVLFAVAALLGVCGGGDGGSPGGVGMVAGQKFDPPTVRVSVGDTVTWTNESPETHTVTAYEDGLPDGASYFSSGGFDSEEDARSNLSNGLIDPDETFEVTFDEPGTYDYFCIPHEGSGMKGTIVVE